MEARQAAVASHTGVRRANLARSRRDRDISGRASALTTTAPVEALGARGHGFSFGVADSESLSVATDPRRRQGRSLDIGRPGGFTKHGAWIR